MKTIREYLTSREYSNKRLSILIMLLIIALYFWYTVELPKLKENRELIENRTREIKCNHPLIYTEECDIYKIDYSNITYEEIISR